MKAEASLIIPSHNSEKELNNLLEGIIIWSVLPSEILVIDSSNSEPMISIKFEEFCAEKKINFQLVSKKNLFPGKARNIGIKKASCSLIAFLDVSTIPTADWFESCLDSLNDKNYDGAWGSTLYEANSWFHKLIRSATFGNLPLQTIPGSIIRKKTFKTSGLFIESTRAGEDADWMSRARLHQFNFTKSLKNLNYIGLTNMTLLSLIKKWFRNYSYGAKLPSLNAHKDLYFYFFALLIVIIAANWNNLSYDDAIRGWNTESFAYIPNITKISILFFSLFYITVRAVFIPIKKGVPILFIIFNIPMIILISLILDIVKSAAFLNARFLKLN